jgi:3-oxoacyl-[acyl-carrier-protein] synthase II
VLERYSVARARGARIYGEMLGYGIASDAKGAGRFNLRGFGLESAMRTALDRAGFGPGDVTAIWANSNGHRHADAAEAKAIRRLCGDRSPVVAPKRLFGEPMGVGGSLNAALALMRWQHGDAGEVPAGPVLVNSCSMGGTHFSLVLAAPPE